MRNVLAILILLLSAGTSLADGKLYARERVPPDIPYQRALILYQDGKETLVLQSKFQTSAASSKDTALGWVVPVPSVPELASMNGRDARHLFSGLDMVSHPWVTTLGPLVYATTFLVILAVSWFSLFAWLLSLFLPKRPFAIRRRPVLVRVSIYGLIFCVAAPVVFPFFMAARGKAGVEVLRAEEVGVYDAKVIKSADSGALRAWLTEEGFAFAASDEPVLDHYIRAGWCFVVAKVWPEVPVTIGDRTEGLLEPLILRFATVSPVYPLALTSTVGTDTQVLVYFLSDRKMSCGERLKLHFAGAVPTPYGDRPGVLQDGFLPWETSLNYLCKFKGRLTPEQMQTDLTFVPAPDNKNYREHITKW